MVIHRTVLQSQFLVNDDSALMLASDGSLWGSPTPDLVYTNPTIGLILAILGRAIPGVPWYTLMLDMIMFVTLAVVVAMWRHRLPAGADHEWLIMGVFMVSVQAWIWTNLSFTASAILLAGVGALLMAHQIDDSGRDALLRSLLGGSMIGFSIWLRWASALGALILIVPYLVAVTGTKVRWKALLPGAMVAMLFFGVGAGTTWYRYHDSPVWQDYFEYNSARSEIHDSARRFHIGEPDVLASTGWDGNDAQLFSRWYFPDKNVFSYEHLQAAVNSSTGQFSASGAISKAWHNQYKQVIVAVAASIVLAALMLSRGRGRWALAGLWGWTISISLALAVTRKLPGRVALAFVFLVAMAALVQQRPDHYERKHALRAVLAVMVILGVLSAVNLAGDQGRMAEKHRQFEAISKGMSAATSPDGLVVSWAGAYHGEWINPTNTGDSIPVDLLPLGWQTFSPPWAALAESHGVSDVTLSIATDPSVLLAVNRKIVPDDKSFERFASEHLGLEGRLRPVARIGENAEIELADIEVQIGIDADRKELVETGLDGSEVRRSLTDPAGSGWVMSTVRWPFDVLGWVDTESVGPPVDPARLISSRPEDLIPPFTPGHGDVWVAVLYKGSVSDLELAVPDPHISGRWWFDGRVRGGDGGDWTVYLLYGDLAYPIDALATAD